MAPVDSGYGSNHWDREGSQFGATAVDNSARIHQGNSGEEVVFTYSGGVFDLLNIDIEAITLQLATSVTGTFLASSGATHTVSTIGMVDFTILSGWTNITSFTFFTPNEPQPCDGGTTVNCSGIVFDNINFQEHVSSDIPEPATIALLSLGIAGIGFKRYMAA